MIYYGWDIAETPDMVLDPPSPCAGSGNTKFCLLGVCCCSCSTRIYREPTLCQREKAIATELV